MHTAHRTPHTAHCMPHTQAAHAHHARTPHTHVAHVRRTRACTPRFRCGAPPHSSGCLAPRPACYSSSPQTPRPSPSPRSRSPSSLAHPPAPQHGQECSDPCPRRPMRRPMRPLAAPEARLLGQGHPPGPERSASPSESIGEAAVTLWRRARNAHFDAIGHPGAPALATWPTKGVTGLQPGDIWLQPLLPYGYRLRLHGQPR